jgi:radical SAM superfamily enzyme YgiQ (UPF0313 family)
MAPPIELHPPCRARDCGNIAHPSSAYAAAMRCLLLYPEFQSASFWNYREACRIKGARYPAAPLGMLTVAALLPREWELRLVDRNVEEFDEALFDWADLVFVGGMIAQQPDHLALVAKAKARGKRVISGGPDATNSPHLYDGADHLVLGEAEVTLPAFLADLAQGKPAHVYRSEERADLTRSPPPRWELAKPDRYAYVGLQWSRGCPFNCEFCDIIELFGRVPRHKRVEQVLAELENLYALGWRGAVDVVDDNFIGNQKEAAGLLSAMAQWQEAHGWPFEFGTEVSLNLADRPKLLEAMRKAGFCVVFTGIESADQAALQRMNKFQNAKRDIRAAVHTIHKSGMMVMAGYILGVDGEDPHAADRIIELIDASAVPVDMVGLLFALPSTQLARRLAKEGRLPKGFEVVDVSMGGDQCSEGLNFETTRPKADILRDYVRILRAIYSPAAYFDRVLRMSLELEHGGRKLSLGARGQLKDAATFFRMIWNVGFRRSWGWRWWKLLALVLLRNPRSIRYALWMATLYVHFSVFTPGLIARIEARAAALTKGAAAAA